MWWVSGNKTLIPAGLWAVECLLHSQIQLGSCSSLLPKLLFPIYPTGFSFFPIYTHLFYDPISPTTLSLMGNNCASEISIVSCLMFITLSKKNFKHFCHLLFPPPPNNFITKLGVFFIIFLWYFLFLYLTEKTTWHTARKTPHKIKAF